MNQILSTSMPTNNKKNKAPKQINMNAILRFFVLSLMIFGTLCLGTGAYSFYKNHKEIKDRNVQPTISTENKSENIILLKITHPKVIKKVEYGWNDEEKTVVNGTGGQYVEKEITIPSGNNILHVIIYDELGNEIPFEKQYELKSNINIEKSGNNIKIVYSGDKSISYMTYRWDDGEETTIEINDSKFEQEIEAQKGLHTLTVVVVDEDNNTETKEQKINGVSKPKVEVDIDEAREHFVIYASDEVQLERMEIRLNENDEQKYVLNLKDKNIKELQYKLPIELQIGENLIEVTIYNINDVATETAARFLRND
ncbi:MAG: hypothetical protein HFJ59_07935 [Clostridia bacterium]|nr:hypothetical protein [Clostridia bacterium]